MFNTSICQLFWFVANFVSINGRKTPSLNMHFGRMSKCWKERKKRNWEIVLYFNTWWYRIDVIKLDRIASVGRFFSSHREILMKPLYFSHSFQFRKMPEIYVSHARAYRNRICFELMVICNFRNTIKCSAKKQIRIIWNLRTMNCNQPSKRKELCSRIATTAAATKNQDEAFR